MNSEKLKSYYLLNDREEGELRYKLELTKSDRETLFRIVIIRSARKMMLRD